jgi:hypothetical protein
MKNKLKLIFILSIIATGIAPSTANADGTYAVLDSAGNVTNIIVCGSACSSGEFGGNKVVPQVAADPVTNENRGGFWQGPGTTSYNNGTFTMNTPDVVVMSEIEVDQDGVNVESKTTVNGRAFTFNYNDTIDYHGNVSDLLKETSPKENTSAIISVKKDSEIETITFEKRSTENEILQKSVTSQLKLINSKIQTLLRLLGNWVK